MEGGDTVVNQDRGRVETSGRVKRAVQGVGQIRARVVTTGAK